MLMADLEPVTADLPTVPSDKVETIEDQLPEVPTTVRLTSHVIIIQKIFILSFTGTKIKDQNSCCSCCKLVRAYLYLVLERS